MVDGEVEDTATAGPTFESLADWILKLVKFRVATSELSQWRIRSVSMSVVVDVWLLTASTLRAIWLRSAPRHKSPALLVGAVGKSGPIRYREAGEDRPLVCKAMCGSGRITGPLKCLETARVPLLVQQGVSHIIARTMLSVALQRPSSTWVL